MQKNFYLGLKKIKFLSGSQKHFYLGLKNFYLGRPFLSGSKIFFQKNFYLVRRGSRRGSNWHLKFSIRLGAVRVTTKASDRPKGIVGKVSASFPQPAS